MIQIAIVIVELYILIWLVLLGEMKFFKIPNIITIPFILIGLLTNVFIFGGTGLVGSALGVLIPVLFTILINAIYKSSIPFGLTKLFAAIGSIMGFEMVISIILLAATVGYLVIFLLTIIYKPTDNIDFINKISISKLSFLTYPKVDNRIRNVIRFTFFVLFVAAIAPILYIFSVHIRYLIDIGMVILIIIIHILMRFTKRWLTNKEIR